MNPADRVEALLLGLPRLRERIDDMSCRLSAVEQAMKDAQIENPAQTRIELESALHRLSVLTDLEQAIKSGGGKGTLAALFELIGYLGPDMGIDFPEGLSKEAVCRFEDALWELDPDMKIELSLKTAHAESLE